MKFHSKMATTRAIEKDYSLGTVMEEYETDSDLNSEVCWESENEAHSNMKTVTVDVQESESKELVPFIDDDEVEMDSEEERDILKEIRSEIQNQVRADLKDEIDVYQKKLEYLEREAAGEVPNSHRGDDTDDKDMDPKLKAAILKMKKLDRILSRKMKKEKEVKRDRLLLQKRLREELEQIKPEGRDDSREVKANMEKFLMLALPPSHSEGIDLTEEPPVTPVFHTQLNENEFENRVGAKNKNRDRNNDLGDQTTKSAGSSRSEMSGSSSRNEDTSSLKNEKQQGKKKSKNFIKRNKELASDADNPIPMTDDEKQRINDLLGDLEEIPDLPPELTEQTLNTAWTSDNPFQISVHSGEGYLPEQDDKCSLERIDSQLRMLRPDEDMTSLRTAEYTPDRQRLLSAQATVVNGSDTEFERLGEKALQEKKDERDLQTRLRRIEEELNRLKNPGEEIEIDTPQLSEDALHDLIDQCVFSLSRSTLHTARDGDQSPQSDYATSRLSLLENPPKLDDDVLQRLLTEARSSMCSGRVTTDRGDINDVRNHQFTKELGIEPISRETWDVILSHDISDSDQETPVPGSSQSYDFDQLSDRSERERTGQYRQSDRHDGVAQMNARIPTSDENFRKLNTNTPLSVQSFRDSENYDFSSSRGSRLSQTPFLPEISHSPYLVTQGAATDMMRSQESSVDSDRTVRSVEHLTGSRNSEVNPVPRPPASEKPQNVSQSNRSRTQTSTSTSIHF